jgi:hypothetical protein
VSTPIPEFTAVILCEDVREEVGNKKSLMGVLPGDIIVGELPAFIHLALFTMCRRPNLDSALIEMRLLQDEEEIVVAGIAIPSGGTVIATGILPKALVRFERECLFSIRARFEGGPETTILEKKIVKGNPSAPLPA